MTEFETKLLNEISELKKQQAEIIEILNKSLDMALGEDSFNQDFDKELFNRV